MEDERWTTKDKLEQFRGVTGLYNNTHANITEKTSALRKKQSKDIKNLTVQNKKFHQQYEEVLHGDKKNLLPALSSHPTMQLAFKNLNPQEIEEELKQSIFCKNKELDRLRYKRKNLEKIFLNKKLELVNLKNEADEDPENYLWEQEIANQIQNIKVKQNVARSNRTVYEKALDILQKDAIRFDEVLEGLRKDLVHQCESIVRAVEMGQSVTHELNSLQREYKVTERAVRTNMRQRDRAIRALRADVDNLRLHGHNTLRESSRAVLQPDTLRQSEDVLSAVDEDGDTNVQALLEMHVKREITVVESILNEVKEAAMVHRLQDICPRMEEQKRQRIRLEKQVKENEEHLANMLELHNQLDVMLEVVQYHTMTDEAKQFKEDRVQLHKNIEEERENIKVLQSELVSIGEKMVSVRTALLTLNMMLDTVYGDTSIIDLPSISSDTVMSHGGTSKPLYQPNTEALTLMDQVSRKVRWLVERTTLLDTAVTAAPKPTSQFTVEAAPQLLGVEDEADNIVSDMLDELEDLDDPSVLTRKDVKAESQRLVDLYDNPMAMFQENKEPKFRKHKCF